MGRIPYGTQHNVIFLNNLYPSFILLEGISSRVQGIIVLGTIVPEFPRWLLLFVGEGCFSSPFRRRFGSSSTELITTFAGQWRRGASRCADVVEWLVCGFVVRMCLLNTVLLSYYDEIRVIV